MKKFFSGFFLVTTAILSSCIQNEPMNAECDIEVAKITKEQIRKIAEQKMPDLNAATVETAMSMIAGTARSMGVTVVD